MHTIDLVIGCAAVLVLILLAAVLARQRYMLRVAGGVPVAFQVRGARWTYGIVRFVGGQLRWYRAIGLGTHPSAVLERSRLRIASRRAVHPAELAALPATAVVVELLDGSRPITLALSESAFTGFVSWLEASAPSL